MATYFNGENLLNETQVRTTVSTPTTLYTVPAGKWAKVVILQGDTTMAVNNNFLANAVSPGELNEIVITTGATVSTNTGVSATFDFHVREFAAP